MNDFLREELQEQLVELQKSRQREKRIAEENEAILTAITALGDAKNREQIFNALIIVLKKYISFDDALVLTKTTLDSSYHHFLGTNPKVSNSCWKRDPKFTRALQGECIVLYDPSQITLFDHLEPSFVDEIQSAMIGGVYSEVSQSIIILTAKESGQLNTESKKTLNRLMPLVERALHDIDQKEKLQEIVEVRTKELANNRQRFIDFAQSVGDWLWETDSKLNVRYQTASKSSIVKIEDNLLDSLIKLKGKGGPDEVTNAIHRLKPFVDVEIPLSDKNFISISGKPFFDESGTYKGYRGTARDISDKKNRIQELEKAQAEALKASKAKSDFLAVMSHEIRTPLNTVLGLLDVIQDSPIAKEQSESLKRMESSAELLGVLISDILDLSKIESGHFSLDSKQSCLPTIIKSSISHHESQAFKKNIRIELDITSDIPETIIIDPTRFTQILFNLIGNAVKFTSKGEVRVSVNNLSRDKLTIEVSDTGIGIAEDKLGSIFGSFQQADTSITRKFGGTGLGLTITKHLVELMNGEISVSSELGKGSTFIIDLPIIVVDEKASSQAMTAQQESYIKRKILLVEDNKTNQMVIQLLLNKLGHDVCVVNNGVEAIDALTLHSNKFDIVFMDLSMPVMDGLEATGIIRSKSINTPIVALTAHAMESDKQKCLDIGMNSFITKPVRIKELKAVLTELESLL